MAESPTTLAEVAARAGVSVSTVSRVLNGRRGISEETRERVEALLAEQHYQRRPRSTRTVQLFDFVISGLDTQWSLAMLRGAEAEAARAGADLVVSTTHGSPVGTPDWVEHVLDRGTDGVVLVVSELLATGAEELARLRVPVVLIDPVGTDLGEYPTVTSTDWAGGRDATDHLLGLGHRRIGFISGPMAQTPHQDRLDGYLAALGRAGIAPDPALIRHGDSMVGGGLVHGGALLDLDEPPTAIVSCSDEQAYGVYVAARDRGVRLPDELSVVGFDDVDLCRWVTPELTTVKQPLEGMAAEATRMVVELTRGGSIANRRVQLASELVIRASTAPPR